MRIRINWGTGIAIFIGIFIMAMAFLIFKANSIEVDLVEKDYYPMGLNYQEEIDHRANLAALGEEPVITISEGGVTVNLPDYFSGKQVRGNIQVYRPSDARLDIKDTLKGISWSVSDAHLRHGKYILLLDWASGGVSYHWEGNFLYPGR